MIAVITLIFIALLVAFVLLIAAAMLSSHISHMEVEYMPDEFLVNSRDIDTPAGHSSS